MNFSVALTEDNNINRKTFMQKINAFPDLTVIFSSNNGHECLEHLKGLPHQQLPQVIFMDLEMPEMDGIETILIAKSLYPQIHFVVLTVFDDDEKIFEAIKAGASGYLLKHEPAEALHEAILNVITYGGAPMSPAIARKTMSLLSKSSSDVATTAAIPKILTEREQEVLQHMVKGWDAKRISVELNLSVLTIRKHIANIYQKLHVNSKAQVISLAHKNNWV
ncbi:MAG: response regulator transcription factor [Chitinophagaceae bacterium]|nr:response regulator transcription factor [Chitinophagaceae bacterium]MBL0055487.1 response regulator transcription factor [Chitinophagaceae bacterium]